MKIDFFNKCSKNVLLKINDNEFFLMKPLEKKIILLDGVDKFSLIIRKEESSFFQKKKFRKKYILTVETKYVFEDMGNKDISLTIVRETVRVTGEAYYDKLVLCKKASNVNEHSSICDIKKIKSIYNKRYYLNNILISPFEHLTLLCFGILILTLLFAVKIDLLFSFVFFIITYLFVWILDNVIRKLSNMFHKKAFAIEDDKSEFEKIISEQYINNFYQMEILQAYNNDISRDELL